MIAREAAQHSRSRAEGGAPRAAVAGIRQNDDPAKRRIVQGAVPRDRPPGGPQQGATIPRTDRPPGGPQRGTSILLTDRPEGGPSAGLRVRKGGPRRPA